MAKKQDGGCSVEENRTCIMKINPERNGEDIGSIRGNDVLQCVHAKMCTYSCHSCQEHGGAAAERDQRRDQQQRGAAQSAASVSGQASCLGRRSLPPRICRAHAPLNTRQPPEHSAVCQAQQQRGLHGVEGGGALPQVLPLEVQQGATQRRRQHAGRRGAEEPRCLHVALPAELALREGQLLPRPAARQGGGNHCCLCQDCVLKQQRGG